MAPIEPTVVQVMRQHKEALLARDAAQMQAMARRWLQVEQALDAQIALLAREAAERQAAGRVVSRASLYRLARYQDLLQQLRRELAGYQTYAADLITQEQRAAAQAGLAHAAEGIQASYTVRLGTYFDRLPVSAVEHMAGLAGDGSPLRALLAQSWPDAVEGLTGALIRSTALGINPRQTAVLMRRAMTCGGLGRAITIARTEQLRVYRAAGDLQYQTSGVVTHKLRLAAHQVRTCLACLAREGELIPLDEPMYDHVCGRCTAVPVVRGTRPPQWTQGETWFRGLAPAQQRQMMGAERYHAWQAGRFDFGALATTTHNETWGKGLQVTPLSALLQ